MGSDSKPVEKVVEAQPIVRIKRLKSIAVSNLGSVSDSQMSRPRPGCKKYELRGTRRHNSEGGVAACNEHHNLRTIERNECKRPGELGNQMLFPDESNGVGIKGVDGQSQSKSLDLLPELDQRVAGQSIKLRAAMRKEEGLRTKNLGVVLKWAL